MSRLSALRRRTAARNLLIFVLRRTMNHLLLPLASRASSSSRRQSTPLDLQVQYKEKLEHLLVDVSILLSIRGDMTHYDAVANSSYLGILQFARSHPLPPRSFSPALSLFGVGKLRTLPNNFSLVFASQRIQEDHQMASAQQRKVASGRPSGTDGSDFSFRMVVDSRYQKVAKGKLRLGYLIFGQVVSQIIALALLLLTSSKEKELDRFAILSISTGFLSIILGEIGRRRSKSALLRLYTSISTISVLWSVACIINSPAYVKVMQQQSLIGLTTFELADAARVVLSVGLQVFVIVTSLGLVQNMSPKRDS
ncbi:jagunal-like protein [Rhynchospora pubera]|uniref:Jagunal-like protein n=2 Tax=Rhynchospora pubera TaxID=906938 RepID=A0AAV8E8F9_9POAL|nr:jagunal-like protein [Rhynchospora pubera]